MTASITAIILTFNEEQHIARCIESLKANVERVCVVDSFSSDRTIEIAKGLGADVFQNPWKNYATQFQWGLENCDVRTKWTMRIDADEYLEPALQRNLKDYMTNDRTDVDAIYLRRKIVFMGQSITHGFFYPSMMLRIWKTGKGSIEQRWMDEHIILGNPRTETIDGDLIDENLNELTWWVSKHNGYATREVFDMIATMENNSAANYNTPNAMTGQAARKRFLKEKVYARLPSNLRASFYFFYRYILGFGFLDGKAGFYFHFMQAYWYRTLVEAKLFELQRDAEQLGLTPFQLLQQRGIFP